MNGLIKAIQADWVFSPDGWIEGGWLIVDEKSGEVIEFSRKLPPSCKKENTLRIEGCALFPALINAHTHLELSGMPSQAKSKDYFSWVRKIIVQKTETSPEEMEHFFWQSIKEMLSSGTQGCGDITNVPLLPTKSCIKFSEGKLEQIFNRHIFWELIGFNVGDIVDCLKEEQRKLFFKRERTEKLSLVPHAVYSTSQNLIKQTFRWSRSRHKPFSIHAGEHEEELQFLMEGKGPCRELLEELGRWDSKWSPPKMSAVEYLDRLGTLDGRTLLVHCVHFSEKDWDIVASRGCYVCFCFRSNNFLKVGFPKVEEALKRGIKIVLGTDSLASNEDLNMFREVEFILHLTSSFKPDDLLRFATYNGRNFFKVPLRKTSLLCVELEGATTHQNITERILEKCLEGKFRWICQGLDLEE